MIDARAFANFEVTLLDFTVMLQKTRLNTVKDSIECPD
jgi:hypothetical protein